MEGDDENNRRILFAAAWRGEEDKLKGLIDSGAVPINAVDENKVTALRFTAQYGHKELTRFLIEKGANPNLKVTVMFLAFNLSAAVLEIDRSQETLNVLSLNRPRTVWIRYWPPCRLVTSR